MISPGLAAVIAAEIVLKPGCEHDPPGVPVPAGVGATNQTDGVAENTAEDGSAKIITTTASGTITSVLLLKILHAEIISQPWTYSFRNSYNLRHNR
jgi:hypothetical protein